MVWVCWGLGCWMQTGKARGSYYIQRNQHPRNRLFVILLGIFGIEGTGYLVQSASFSLGIVSLTTLSKFLGARSS